MISDPHENRDELNDAAVIEISDETRALLLDTHPILEREYILPTPMILQTYGIIRERIWARRTGIVFYGSPRMGKTRCLLAIKDQLKSEFPTAYVAHFTARSTTRPSDAHVFRMILESEQHKLANRKDSYLLFDNLKADIQIKSGERSGKQYVLLIDEMQLLNDIDLRQLLCLHNSLEMERIKMTTISFAQPEIVHRRSALMTTNDRQIIARFLCEPIEFLSCRSSKEFGRLLISYDMDSEYPENSGWSYTRFFLPIAFKSGFRLAQYAEAIWTQLVLVAGTPNAIPMEHVCLTIEHLLLTVRKQDRSNFTLQKKHIVEAVNASNLRSFSNLINLNFES